ncbi:MAG: hypothetical protein U1E65_34055 [Myxococcota bacterium]
MSDEGDDKTEWASEPDLATEFVPPERQPSAFEARPLIARPGPAVPPAAAADVLKPAPLSIETSEPAFKLPPRTPGLPSEQRAPTQAPVSEPPSSGVTPPSVTPSGEEWTDEKLERTSHALAGARFSRAFNAYFQQWASQGVPRRTVELKVPDERTLGGVQSRQSILLVSEDRSATLLVGWVDLAQQAAEVRSHAYLAAQYRQRRRKKLELRRDEFDLLSTEIRRFLELQQIALTLVDTDEDQESQGESQTPVAWIVVGVVLGVVVAFLVFRLSG